MASKKEYYYHRMRFQDIGLQPSFDLNPALGVSVVDGKLAAITEQSNNAYSCSQPTVSARPAWIPNASNASPALRFSGAQWLSFGDVWDIGTKPRTIFVVAKTTIANPTASQFLIAKSQTNGSANRFGLGYSASKVLSPFLQPDMGANVTTSGAASTYNNNMNVLAMRVYPGNGVNAGSLSGWFNGSIRENPASGFSGEAALSITPYNVISANRLLIGAYNAGTDTGESSFFTGDILRVIGYDENLTNSQMIYETNRLSVLYIAT